MSNISKNKRKLVISKFNGKCSYCGCTSNDMTIDHIMPTSKGGNNHIDNLIPSCRSCNSTKGNMSIDNYILYMNYIHIAKKHGFSLKQIKFLLGSTNFSEAFSASGYVPFFMRGSHEQSDQ